jgi:hypothetical protein
MVIGSQLTEPVTGDFELSQGPTNSSYIFSKRIKSISLSDFLLNILDSIWQKLFYVDEFFLLPFLRL